MKITEKDILGSLLDGTINIQEARIIVKEIFGSGPKRNWISGEEADAMKASNPNARFGVGANKDGSSRYFIPAQDELDNDARLERSILSNEENETPEETARWAAHMAKFKR